MKIGEYEQMMAHLKDSFNPSELRAKVAELQQREGFAKGTGPGGPRPRTDLLRENLTRKEYGSYFKNHPKEKNIIYTDFKNKETGEVFRKYGVRVRVQDKNVQKIATTGDKYREIDSLEEAVKLRDNFRKKNPANIKPRDPKKDYISKDTRRFFEKSLQGRMIKFSAPKGYVAHHTVPLAGKINITNQDIAIISDKMNAELAQYDKPMNKLVNEAFALNFDETKSLKRLDEINKKLASYVKNAIKKLGPEYEGLIGFNKLTPVLDTFDDKGNQVFYSEKKGIDVSKTIGAKDPITDLKDMKTSVIQEKVSKARVFDAIDTIKKSGVNLTKSQINKIKQRGSIDVDLLKDIGRTAGSGALKTLAALDIPILQLGFASMTDFTEDNPLMTTIPLMFTDEASKLTGLYNQSGGKFKKFMRLAARAGVPLEKAKTIFPMISKVGRIGSLAAPVLETIQEGYKAARNVSRAKEEARNFGIPEEQAMEGLEKMYALNRPVVGDYMDAPEMSERGKANIESLKRDFQQFGSFFGLSEDPYAMREQKAEGDKPKGAAKMTRRTFLKLASLVPAVLTGAAAIRFGPAKTKKIFTAIENLKKTTTKLPTWFKGFADKFRNTGDSVNIYKKQKVPISKGEYERAELAKEANVYSDTARTLDYKKNNPHHMDYYRLVDTDELVGTTYTNKDMPGIQIDDFADGELSVKFENDYSQESELVYVKPGSKYSDYQVGDKRYMYEQFNPEETSKTKGDFIAYDSQPISTTPDGDYDIDAVVVDDVGNMLEGTTRSMEEYYTGKPVEEISAGEKQIMRAEMKAEDIPDDD